MPKLLTPDTALYYCITISDTDRGDIMFSINSRSSLPIFEQIVQQVAKYIAIGILKPHDQLPTVRILAKELGINPNTVSKAYHECEMAGLIYSVAGKGSFVSDTTEGLDSVLEDAYSLLASAYQQLIELGEDPETVQNFLKRAHS